MSRLPVPILIYIAYLTILAVCAIAAAVLCLMW